MPNPDVTLKFGGFEFDLKRSELRKRGLRVRMSASQTRLLTLFLERPGELITRDEITARLWTDTGTIDIDTGINTAINRLRTTLNDNPAKPALIETVIGAGYRFIAEVEVLRSETPAVPEPAPEQPTPAASSDASSDAQSIATPLAGIAPVHRSRTGWSLGIAAAIVAALAFGTALRGHRPAAVDPVDPPPHPANNLLHFSPITFDVAPNLVTAQALAPDGQSMAYADNSGVSMHWFDSRPERLLAAVPAVTVAQISWAPDGSQLLISGTNSVSHQHEAWMIPPFGAYSRLVVPDANLATLSPDGNSIAFTRRHDTEVWISTAEGAGARKLFTSAANSAITLLLWSPDSRRLVVESHSVALPRDVAPDRWSYQSVDSASGAVLASQDDLRIESAYLLPNGRMDFLPGDHADLMSVQTDPASGRLLGTPSIRKKLEGQPSNLSASRDGTRIALIEARSNSDIFVAPLHLAAHSSGVILDPARRLTFELYDSYPHAWTRDGGVLFETGYRGRTAIFEQHIDSSDPKLLAAVENDAAMAQITPDGKWILFLQFHGPPGGPILYRAPAAGGTPERVPTTGVIEEFHCPQTLSASCVLRESVGRERLAYYALDPVQGMGKLLAQTPWSPNRLGDWGISPDGRTVSVAGHDIQHPAVHFVRLDGSSPAPPDIPLNGHGTLLGANWAPDGHTLFVECKTGTTYELVSLDLSGQVKKLRESAGLIWGVPSPDGRMLAFPGIAFNANVWVADAAP